MALVELEHIHNFILGRGWPHMMPLRQAQDTIDGNSEVVKLTLLHGHRVEGHVGGHVDLAFVHILCGISGSNGAD